MKIKHIFSLAALALMTAACSSDENTQPQSAPSGKTLPFRAVITAGAPVTRGLTEASDGKSITATWEEKEKVALIHGETIDVLEVAEVDLTTGAAVITGNITNAVNDEDVYVVYVGHQEESMDDYVAAWESWKSDNPDTDIPASELADPVFQWMATQSGTLEGIQDGFDFRYSPTGDQTAKLVVTDDGASLADQVRLFTKYSIWKLNLTTDGTTALKASQFLMTDANKNQYIVDLGESTASEFYLSFLATGTEYSFEAAAGDKTYVCTPTISSALADGKFYTSTLTMTEVNNSYLVYDSSGDATEKKPSGATIWTGTVTAGDVAAGTYIVDGTVTYDGELFLTGDINLILKDGASLTVNGNIVSEQENAEPVYSMTLFGQAESTGKLSLSGSSSHIYVNNLTVHGGDITVSGDGITTEGVITVYHGTINATTGETIGIMNSGGMYVYGGEVTASSTDTAIFSEKSDLTIAGGQVTVTSTSSDGISAVDGNIIITGGTVNCNSDGFAIKSTTSIEISGGDVTAKSTGTDAAGMYASAITISGNSTIVNASGDNWGISSYVSEGTATITIEGGDITATAGFNSVSNNGGFGISASEIIVSGGDVKANGGDAAAGSGAAGGAGIDGALTVNGGTVTAIGGNGADSSEGNGGRGGHGIQGNVSVTDGTVVANGGKGGNGGDGGYGGDGGDGIYGTVTVTAPGTVTATGGSGGSPGTGGEAGRDGEKINDPNAAIVPGG